MTDTTTFPFRSIIRVFTRFGSDVYSGSGVLISPDEVLTAAHMVWQTGVGVANAVAAAPGYDQGNAPFGVISGTVTHYNAIYDADDLISRSSTPLDYAIIHLAAPVATGFMSIGSNVPAGLAFVSGYPGTANGAQVDQVESFGIDGYGNLTAPALGPGSSGGPVWTTDSAGAPSVVGLVSSGDAVGNGNFMRITTAVRATLLGWIAQDDGQPRLANYIDTKTGANGAMPLTVATTGPNYLDWQYIWSSPDAVALSTSMPNTFLHGGTGNDAIQVVSGQNVLDGGTGSNFLVGGSGTDTFFTDARGTAVVWNTLSNFHAGDTATLWGFVTGVSSYRWETDPAGAPGSTGATLRANLVGGAGRTGNGIDASITFAGLSVNQAQHLVISTGTQAAGPYLLLSNPGV